MSYFSAREARTTVPCPNCGADLYIKRSCLNVAMCCKQCEKSYPLRQFIDKADNAMEVFLENVYMDRI